MFNDCFWRSLQLSAFVIFYLILDFATYTPPPLGAMNIPPAILIYPFGGSITGSVYAKDHGPHQLDLTISHVRHPTLTSDWLGFPFNSFRVRWDGTWKHLKVFADSLATISSLIRNELTITFHVKRISNDVRPILLQFGNSPSDILFGVYLSSFVPYLRYGFHFMVSADNLF